MKRNEEFLRKESQATLINEFHDRLAVMVNEYGSKMPPYLVVAILTTFATEIAFTSAPSKKAALEVLKNIWKASIENVD